MFLRPIVNGPGRAWRAASAACLLFCASLAGPAEAQPADCVGLQREIAAAQRRPSGGAAAERYARAAERYARAAERQRTEIDRTLAYGTSIGCWRQSIFTREPAACGELDARIARMRGNLEELQAQADASAGARSADIEQLRLDYDAYCRAPRRDPQRAATGDDLFGATPPGMRRVPLDDVPPDEPAAEPDDGTKADEGARGGSEAICVRSCDGGYFPLSVPARSGKLEDLQTLCTALCPNVEAKLYTMAKGAAVADAVAPTGELYSAHPNAFRFRKKYDAACACKPANKEWGQVLGEAEKIIGKETGGADKTLTPAQAEALSKPQPAKPTPPPAAAPPEPKKNVRQVGPKLAPGQ
ncbi:MAG: DUF2865 domain-containing protein [Rhizobiales bacterium]|nr:DUF2865 domain-containing protein [Hyphomicrobiales bacterium]